MSLDEKGRCCGRKPISYKRDRHLFCDRCDRRYDMDTHEQVENWAWVRNSDGKFIKKPRLVTPCCDALAEAMKPGSDHMGIGPLMRREGNTVQMTFSVPPLRWCPWCGRSLLPESEVNDE